MAGGAGGQCGALLALAHAACRAGDGVGRECGRVEVLDERPAGWQGFSSLWAAFYGPLTQPPKTNARNKPPPGNLSPFRSLQATQQAAATPRARKKGADLDEVDETFIPPIIAPSTPSRLYFRFGQPIRLPRSMCKVGVLSCVCCLQLHPLIASPRLWHLLWRASPPATWLSRAMGKLACSNLPFQAHNRDALRDVDD